MEMPSRFLETEKIAPDTHVLRQVVGAGRSRPTSTPSCPRSPSKRPDPPVRTPIRRSPITMSIRRNAIRTTAVTTAVLAGLVAGPGHRFARLAARGDVCGHWLQPPTSVVTHVFTGRYLTVASSRPVLVGTDGWLEIRVADRGVASTTAVDT